MVILLDGLDEFELDIGFSLNDFLDLVRSLSDRPRTKVMLLSRPLPAFEHEFEGRPRICLHEVNEGDILCYVQAKLNPERPGSAFSRPTPRIR